MDSIRAGSNVDSWCTKCKLVLAHTVEAVAGDVIKRVVCNTCGGKHQFKAKKPGTKAKSATTKSAKDSKSKAKIGDYSKLLGRSDLSTAKGYGFTQKYTKGDLINHSKFGMGIVVVERDAQKIEVLFEFGTKLLVHSKAL